MKTKTLLAIGDNCDFEAFKKFKLASKGTTGLRCLNINYSDVLSKRLPKIKTDEVMIFLFFPFDYWDSKIEPKWYKGTYGNKRFYEKFVDFCETISKIIKSAYKDKRVSYIIHPDKMYIDRDKELTKDILKKAGVSIPKTIKTRSLNAIKALAKKKNIFIKSRYGAMGKGITYLSKDRWMTNFRFKDGKIKSKKSDYGWTFIDIKGNDAFLKELLKQDITIEEEISPFLIDGKRFDLRIYVSFGKVRYIYPRSNENASITTNISQGGKGENQPFLKKVPKKLLKRAMENAVNAANALQTHFAGVDIMFNGKTKEAIVMEANVFPGFPRSKLTNLSKRIIQDIKSYRGDVNIRQATMDDFEQLFELKLESKRDERKQNKQLEPIDKVKSHYKEYLIKDLESKYRVIFIAIYDDEVIGMIVGRIYRSLKVAGYERRGSIGSLYVKEEYRGKQIGKKLVKALTDWFRSRGAVGLTLAVYKGSKIAENMYSKMGFNTYCNMMYKKI